MRAIICKINTFSKRIYQIHLANNAKADEIGLMA